MRACGVNRPGPARRFALLHDRVLAEAARPRAGRTSPPARPLGVGSAGSLGGDCGRGGGGGDAFDQGRLAVDAEVDAAQATGVEGWSGECGLGSMAFGHEMN